MMKRILSFLLCLIMVVSLAAPSVQASSTDDVITSDNIMDNVYIENGSDANIVIDGNTVNTSQDSKLPNPADLVTEPTEPPYVFGEIPAEEPVAVVGCQCVDLSTAVEHSGVCEVKAPYMELCGNASAEELYAQWGNYTLVEQDFIQDYLYEAFPQKSSELEKLLNAPTGSASEILTDGTTVSVEGIPQDGSLTVGDADAVKDIVDTYVAEQEMLVSPLFSYDVSVQDGEGADWQPDVNVKMELELPGEKLHKNTKVFVVHVDDNGVATTIEATVTEDGKIAFETPGFSAFYGFTVDFEFNGVEFSIGGMSNITLSELFVNMNMPLSVEDVANVEFTDYELISVEKQTDGDWLLTSLQAFDTDEKLTLTMSDGAVYQINVTDATDVGNDGYAEVYVGGSTSINYDKGPSGTVSANGEITWNANTSGGSLNAHGWSRTQQVEISGPGTMIINIQNGDDYADETLYVDLLQLKITDGAQVTIRAGGDFVSTNKRVCIRSSAHDVEGCAGWGMIWVQNGSLSIKGRDTSTNIDLVFGGRDDWYYSVKETIDTAYKYNNHPLILLGSGATSLNVKYAEFMHSASGAIGNQKDASPSTMTMTLDHCIFHKSVFNQTKRTGGAVQLKPSSSSGGFTATNCTFNGNTCVYRGGAVSIDTDITNVKFDTCTFTSISSQNHAGAIGIGKDSDVAVSVTKLEILNCGFNTCSAAGRGGALRMLSKGSPTVTIQNSTFYNCSGGTNGGAVTLQGSVGNVSITGTKTTSNGTTTYSTYFNDCTSVSRGGAIDGSCTNYGTITITDVSFARNTGGSHGGAVYLGTNGSNRHSAGAVSVSGCNFEDNQGQGVGGGLCLTEGTFASVALKNTTFNKCRTSGFGGGFGMKVSSESVRETQDVIVTGDTLIQDCTFTNCHGGAMQPEGYEADGVTPVTWNHDGNPASPEIDKLNGTGGGGAIALGGTFSYLEIVGNNTKDMLIQNCTSWNNGGAITFHNGMTVTGKTVSGKTVAVKFQYLDMDKCFARDAGNAVYFGGVRIYAFQMSDCTVQNCDSFDVGLEANKANFTSLITTNKLFDDVNFGTPTIYVKDSNGNIVKNDDGSNKVDTEATAAKKTELLTKWHAYTNEDLYESFDNGGTIRTVGDSAINATIDNCVIENNGSLSTGGGVYWNANNVVMNGSTVALTPKIVISNTDFTGNRAAVNGGGLFCEAYVEVLSCNFTQNSAGANGGGIYQGMYNNGDRQLGESGGTETNNLKLGTATGASEPTKIYNNTAKNGGGIAITVGGTNSYPHTLKDGITEGTEAARKPENWNFLTNFTYEMKFELGGAHVYENKATENGGGIYYSAASYKDPEGNILEGTDTNKITWSERQRQLDSFKKDITINNGLIYGNVAGQDAETYAVKVTDASSLQVGDKLIIAAKDYAYAMSTESKDEDEVLREQTAITKEDFDYVVVTSETEVLTLVQGSKSGTFALKIPAGYLNTNTGRAITTTQHIQDSSSWTITINGTGAATLVSQLPDGPGTRNRLFYDCESDYYVNYTHEGIGAYYVEDYGVFRLISTEIENGRLAELVTDSATLKAGDEIVIATLKQFLSMSKSPTANNYRHHKVLTKLTEKTLTIANNAGVEELTLEAGTKDGTYALKTHDGKYLASNTDTTGNDAALLTASSKSDVSSWEIKIHPVTGNAYVVAQGTGVCKYLRFNAAANWFKCYESTSNESYVSIYKVAQNITGGKLAKLVTSASDLRQGDKIIIVSMLENQALGITQGDGNNARMKAPVTKHDRMTFGEDAQVVTLQNGHKDLPGTFALQLPDGRYLRTSSKGLTPTTDLVSTSSWTISVDPSTGVATIGSNGPNSTYTGRELTYNPTERVFSSYANDSQKDVVLYRLESVETGEGGNGGGIYMNSNQSAEVNGGYSKLQISGGSIYSNTAYIGNGGGIYLQGENALCTITGDTTGIGTVCTKSGSTVSLSPDNGNTATGARIGSNNYHGGNGGGIAIFGGARIEMTGGYVVHNSATTAGGGIAVHGGSTMKLTKGYVDGNQASMGGGISLNGAKGTGNAADINTQYGMYFNGGNIRNNHVIPNADGVAYGGGICLAGEKGATMRIDDGEISGNTAANTTEGTTFAAGQEGGGIAVCQASEMTITGGRITSNKAYDGGGMAVRGACKVDMDGTLVLYTKAEADADAALPDGDAHKKGISAGDVNLDLSTGVIAGNSVYRRGGGVYMVNGINTFNMKDGCINANTCIAGDTIGGECKGGGVYLEWNSTFDLDGGHIDDNRASDGGGIMSYVAKVNIKNGYMLRNAIKRNGGAIYSDYSTVNVSGGEFRYNTTDGTISPGNGGAIFSYGSGNYPSVVTITGGEFHNNTAHKYGGAVAVEGSAGSFSVSNANFSNNHSRTDAGALYCSGPKLTVASGTFTNNTASNNGGAIETASNCEFTINGGTFTSNGANGFGGAVYTDNCTSKITTGIFTSNTAGNSGGAVYTTKGTFEISGGTFTSNSATKMGGAVRSYNGAFTISNGTFNNNTAEGDGGAFHAWFGSLSITGGDFNGNVSSAGCGGGIYIKNCNTTISNGTLDNNAGKYGGGLYIVDSGNVTFTGGSFTNNKSNQGAGIFIRTSTVTIANVTVSSNIVGTDSRYNNDSNKFGGGLYVDAYGTSTVTVNSGDFTSNEAPYGGGIYVGNRQNNSNNVVTLKMNGGTVSNNKATIDGGGIYVNGGGIVGTTTVINGIPTFSGCTSVIMTGGKVFKNSADVGCGGGIYATSAGKVSIQGTSAMVGEISENTAKNGGGVYVTGSAELYVHNGQIIKNTAVGASGQGTAYGIDPGFVSGVGGGIYVTSGSDTAASKFVLSGNDMAIYGNTATFAADDVFSNGNNTKLDVPKVTQMNLVGYGFNPEGWVEDYATYDSKYAECGTNMIGVYGKTASVSVLRYRNATAAVRRYMLIKPEYVSGKYDNGTALSNGVVYANKDDAYVCMTLGIPTAMDDTVVIDYGSEVWINAWQNDLFLDADTTAGGENDFQCKDYDKYGNKLLELHEGTYVGKTFTTGTGNGVIKEYEGTCYLPITKDTIPPFVPTYTNDKGEVLGRRSGIYGTSGVVYSGGNGIFSYTPNKMTFEKEEPFFYATAHNQFWYYAKMTVVPATTIYFEDNANGGGNYFINYHTTAKYEQLAGWESVENGTAAGNLQDEDRPGNKYMDGIDADNVYGHDGHYATSTAFSDGSAMKVMVTRAHTAADTDNNGVCDLCKQQLDHTWKDTNTEDKITACDRCGLASHGTHAGKCTDSDKNYYCDICGKHTSSPNANARAVFTFTGTGFDIISLCSTNTGVVSVSVWDKPVKDIVFEDNPKTDEYEITTPIATYATDTYYQNGGTTGLYQVPVIKADLTKVPVYDQNWNATGEYYGYGTYTVEIYVAPGWYPKDHSYNGCEFYLDAIRIYDPVGYNGSQSQVAQDAYLADGEGWPVYQELRNLVLSRYEADFEVEGGTDRINTEKDGVIFIDGSDTPSIADYKAWGPNNEVYVKGASSAGAGDGQGVGFVLNAANYAKDGLEIDRVHIGLRGLTDTGTVEIWKGVTLFRTVHISTTDMYYDITGLMNNVLTIKNVGTTPIAISNLKITHKKQPGSGTRGTIVTTDQKTVKAALNVFNAEQLVEVTVTPKRPALSFNGMVCYNVFFDAQDLGDLTAADLGLAVFNTYAPDGTVENANEVHLGAEEIDGLYMVATDGVHAKYLGDAKFFRAFAKKADGSYVYSKMVSYSAVDYAKNILAKSDDVKLKQLVVAMLNYGAEAQKFFGYKTYDLMNKDLTADDLALLNGFDANSLNKVGKVDSTKVGAFASTGGFTKRSPAISFKGAFEINYFMTPAYAVDGDMTMYFWTEDTYNSVTELTAENADKAVVMTPENGSYTACSDEIIAKYLDKTVYVAAVYESNGVTYCSGVLPYSIAAYCQKPPASVQDLATAAAIYGCTAKQYFGA